MASVIIWPLGITDHGKHILDCIVRRPVSDLRGKQSHVLLTSKSGETYSSSARGLLHIGAKFDAPMLALMAEPTSWLFVARKD